MTDRDTIEMIANHRKVTKLKTGFSFKRIFKMDKNYIKTLAHLDYLLQYIGDMELITQQEGLDERIKMAVNARVAVALEKVLKQ